MIDRKTPLLVICEQGEVRSVAFAFVLKHDYDFVNVLNMGTQTTQPATQEMLYRWATIIYIPADTGVYRDIPHKWRSKVKFINIGEDVWRNPSDLRLIALLRKKAESLDL